MRTGGPVAVVVKGYPRLSETFIAQELLSLQQRGLVFTIISLRRPHDQKSHPVHGRIRAPINYLPEYLHDDPVRVLRSWRRARKLAGYQAGRDAFWRDLKRDPTPNRIRRFGQALVLAAEMVPETRSIYVHFLHTPASVARYAALMRGLPLSCSAHAKDIYTTPDWEKAEKIAAMQWLVTCTRANVDYLRRIAGPAAGRISLLYHGLDLQRFQAPRQAAAASPPWTVLSVGRAVPKKGFDVLLGALARLPAGLDWRFIHVGGGTELPVLKKLAADKGIADRISWRGALAQNEVIALYRSAHVFALASRIADDGDRDGLPNVLMEAMSQELVCISTRVAAIPELIEDGVTGLLVPPDDEAALAAGLELLLGEKELRLRLGRAGAAHVRGHFSHAAAIGALAERFGLGADERIGG